MSLKTRSVRGSSIRTHFKLLEFDDSSLLFVQLGFEGLKFFPFVRESVANASDGFPNRIHLSRIDLELFDNLGDFGLRFFELGSVGLDVFQEFDEILLSFGLSSLCLDESILVVSNLILQIGNFRFLRFEL